MCVQREHWDSRMRTTLPSVCEGPSVPHRGVLLEAGERGCGSPGGRTCLSLRSSSCVSFVSWDWSCRMGQRESTLTLASSFPTSGRSWHLGKKDSEPYIGCVTLGECTMLSDPWVSPLCTDLACPMWLFRGPTRASKGLVLSPYSCFIKPLVNQLKHICGPFWPKGPVSSSF